MDNALLDHLKKREGVKYESYEDSLGKPTGGVGHLLSKEEQKKYPIGTKIPKDVVDQWLVQDVNTARNAAKQQLQELPVQDKALEDALVSVNFQLGQNWYKDHKKTWQYLKDGNLKQASQEVYDSNWAKQTPVRVDDFSNTLQSLSNKNEMKDYNNSSVMNNDTIKSISAAYKKAYNKVFK